MTAWCGSPTSASPATGSWTGSGTNSSNAFLSQLEVSERAGAARQFEAGLAEQLAAETPDALDLPRIRPGQARLGPESVVHHKVSAGGEGRQPVLDVGARPLIGMVSVHEDDVLRGRRHRLRPRVAEHEADRRTKTTPLEHLDQRLINLCNLRIDVDRQHRSPGSRQQQRRPAPIAADLDHPRPRQRPDQPVQIRRLVEHQPRHTMIEKIRAQHTNLVSERRARPRPTLVRATAALTPCIPSTTSLASRAPNQLSGVKPLGVPARGVGFHPTDPHQRAKEVVGEPPSVTLGCELVEQQIDLPPNDLVVEMDEEIRGADVTVVLRHFVLDDQMVAERVPRQLADQTVVLMEVVALMG